MGKKFTGKTIRTIVFFSINGGVSIVILWLGGSEK